MNTVTIQDFEQYRIAHKLTKKDFAERLGVSYTFFIALMKGRKNLTKNLILRFESLRKEQEKAGAGFVTFVIPFTDSEWKAITERLGTVSHEEIAAFLRDYAIKQASTEIEEARRAGKLPK